MVHIRKSILSSIFFILLMTCFSNSGLSEVITENHWDTAPSPNQCADGWCIWVTSGMKFSIVQDTTSSNRSNVLRCTFPVGLPGGTGGCNTYYGFGNKSEIYGQYWIKYSSNWQWHGTADKMFYLDDSSPSPTVPYAMFCVIEKGGKVRCANYGQDGRRGVEINVGGATTFEKNRWYKFNFHAKYSTPGNRNGVWQLWVDDRLIMNYSDIGYHDNQLFSSIKFHNVWGGTGGTVLQEMHTYFDDIILSTEPIDVNLDSNKIPNSPKALQVD